MSRRIRRKSFQDAELDITAFMNLMIVLVPVLLLGMVFSQITVLDLKLPPAAEGDGNQQNKRIELVIRDAGLKINYPQGILLKNIPKTEQGKHDFKLLSLVLQEVKRQLREQKIEKRSISILSEPDTSYQTIVSTMDTVRSFKAVVAATVVDAELFPDISFGDAPLVNGKDLAGVAQ
jgi:biopolymer transport protein ExbD